MVDDNGNEIIVGTEFKNEIQLKRWFSFFFIFFKKGVDKQFCF
jgi:hypothetical protein